MEYLKMGVYRNLVSLFKVHPVFSHFNYSFAQYPSNEKYVIHKEADCNEFIGYLNEMFNQEENKKKFSTGLSLLLSWTINLKEFLDILEIDAYNSKIENAFLAFAKALVYKLKGYDIAVSILDKYKKISTPAVNNESSQSLPVIQSNQNISIEPCVTASGVVQSHSTASGVVQSDLSLTDQISNDNSSVSTSLSSAQEQNEPILNRAYHTPVTTEAMNASEFLSGWTPTNEPRNIQDTPDSNPLTEVANSTSTQSNDSRPTVFQCESVPSSTSNNQILSFSPFSLLSTQSNGVESEKEGQSSQPKSVLDEQLFTHDENENASIQNKQDSDVANSQIEIKEKGEGLQQETQLPNKCVLPKMNIKPGRLQNQPLSDPRLSSIPLSSKKTPSHLTESKSLIYIFS
jgi:hypothetical protein